MFCYNFYIVQNCLKYKKRYFKIREGCFSRFHTENNFSRLIRNIQYLNDQCKESFIKFKEFCIWRVWARARVSLIESVCKVSKRSFALEFTVTFIGLVRALLSLLSRKAWNSFRSSLQDGLLTPYRSCTRRTKSLYSLTHLSQEVRCSSCTCNG